jgi:hypothetical protein
MPSKLRSREFPVPMVVAALMAVEVPLALPVPPNTVGSTPEYSSMPKPKFVTVPESVTTTLAVVLAAGFDK